MNPRNKKREFFGGRSWKMLEKEDRENEFSKKCTYLGIKYWNHSLVRKRRRNFYSIYKWHVYYLVMVLKLYISELCKKFFLICICLVSSVILSSLRAETIFCLSWDFSESSIILWHINVYWIWGLLPKYKPLEDRDYACV